MIEIYNIYLKLLGYISFNRDNKILNVLHYIHIFFMFSLLSFPFFYQLVYYIQNWSINIILSSFVTSLEPIQYILTILYFRHKHFIKLILKNGYNKKFIFKLNILTIIIFFISLVYTIICVSVSLSLNKSGITRNDDIIFNNMNRYLYILILIFHKFVSSNVFFSVNIFFTNTLLLHSTYLLKLAKKIKEDSSNNQINILDICKEYFEQKNYYKKTINKLNNIFAITFLTSGTYIYIVIYNILIEYDDNSNYVDYIRMIVYGIMLIIFGYTQDKINKSINEIINNIYNINFLRDSLNRIEIDYNFIDKYNNESKKNFKKEISIQNSSKPNESKPNESNVNEFNPNIFSYIIDRENSKYLDWLVLNNMINIEWDKINFLGFELNGFDIIKQIITIASSLILIIQALKN